MSHQNIYDAERLLKFTEAVRIADHGKSCSKRGFEVRRQTSFDVYGSCCCCVPSQPIPLFKYHDAPDFLHGNPFVIHGYRGKLPLVLCLQR